MIRPKAGIGIQSYLRATRKNGALYSGDKISHKKLLEVNLSAAANTVRIIVQKPAKNLRLRVSAGWVRNPNRRINFLTSHHRLGIR